MILHLISALTYSSLSHRVVGERHTQSSKISAKPGAPVERRVLETMSQFDSRVNNQLALVVKSLEEVWER